MAVSHRNVRFTFSLVSAVFLISTCAGVILLSYMHSGLKIKIARSSQEDTDHTRLDVRLSTTQLSVTRPDFQAVEGLGSLLYIHAALWQGDNVRITVVKKLNVSVDNVLCLLWYSNSSVQNITPYFVKALVKDLFSYNAPIACGYIKCFVQNNGSKSHEPPLFVSLVNRDSPTAGLRITLPVENRDISLKQQELTKVDNSGATNTRDRRMVNFTVCVPTMFDFSNVAMLVEKLEMSRLLGAGRVVLYKTSVHPEVEAVLSWYAQEFAAGREDLEVVAHPWQLPPIRLHYKGQMAAIDDCLYRHKWTSRYMVFTDLDEFIIPLRHANWSQLIAEREAVSPGHAAFMFYSVLMRKDQFSPAKGFEARTSRYDSQVLRVTKREDYLYQLVVKSKLIVNPTKVESLEVHVVSEAYAPTDIVPPDQGVVYHYRQPFDPHTKNGIIYDTKVADKYGEKLALRLRSVWSKLNVTLGLEVP